MLTEGKQLKLLRKVVKVCSSIFKKMNAIKIEDLVLPSNLRVKSKETVVHVDEI